MTKFLNEFNQNISLISCNDESSPLQIKLNYAYIITCMERYLYKALLVTMEENRQCYENLAKGIDSSARLSTIYKIGLDNFIKNITLKNLQYHNVHQVKIYYRNAFDITFPQNLESISRAISKRHDIVHRCGFSEKDEPVNLSYDSIEELKQNIIEFIVSIDMQLEEKYESTKIDISSSREEQQ